MPLHYAVTSTFRCSITRLKGWNNRGGTVSGEACPHVRNTNIEDVVRKACRCSLWPRFTLRNRFELTGQLYGESEALIVRTFDILIGPVAAHILAVVEQRILRIQLAGADLAII